MLCRIGTVAYELSLPPDSQIHLVFHVSQLRAYQGRFASGDFTPIPEDMQTPGDAIEEFPDPHLNSPNASAKDFPPL